MCKGHLWEKRTQLILKIYDLESINLKIFKMSKKTNKTVLILGGSSDIGTETVTKFLLNGWSVIAHSNSNEKKLKKIKKNHPNHLIIIKMNFKRRNSLNLILRKIKKFDISSYINLIGYVDNLSFDKTNLNELICSIQINSLIPILIQKSFLKKMEKRKFGRILHISSIGVKFGGGKNTFNYSFAKNSLEFIPSNIKKMTKFNILTNILRVGVVKTKLHKKIKNKNLNQRIKLIPIKRLAEITEISDMIYFLASENNSYVSNEIISIAGGE